MMKILFLIAMFAVAGLAQQPDRWRGLIIDESAPEKAVEVLGQPRYDKLDDYRILVPKWTGKDAVKSLRVLKYDGIEGFDHVLLGFKNSKLVLIDLQPKKISAQAFVASYNDLSFRFANEVMSPKELTEPRNTNDRQATLGAWYVLVAATEKVFVFGGVGNSMGTVGSTLFGGPGSQTRQTGRSVPGNVKTIQLVSRTLENKDGSDLLK